MSVNKINNRIMILLIIILLLQSPLSEILPNSISKFINGIDEFVVIILIIVIFCKLLKGLKVLKFEKQILILYAFFIFIGILSTIFFSIQPLNRVLEDLISCSKFIITYLGIRSLSSNLNVKYIISRIQKYSKVIIWIFFTLTVISLILPGAIFPVGEKRYALHTIKLFYKQPAALAYIGFALLSIITLTDRGKVDSKYKVMIAFVIFMTLRTRAIAFIFIYFALTLMKSRIKTKNSKIIIILIICGAIIIAFDNISLYYINNDIDTARSILTKGSFILANKTFPLGTGFATYGSAAAAKSYSPLYYLLGFNNRYGLGEINSMYLSDTFWPIIIAQFGYSGVVVFSSIIIIFIKFIFKYIKIEFNTFLSLITLFGYTVISTLGSSSFFNPISVIYGTLMALTISNDVRYKRIS